MHKLWLSCAAHRTSATNCTVRGHQLLSHLIYAWITQSRSFRCVSLCWRMQNAGSIKCLIEERNGTTQKRNKPLAFVTRMNQLSNAQRTPALIILIRMNVRCVLSVTEFCVSHLSSNRSQVLRKKIVHFQVFTARMVRTLFDVRTSVAVNQFDRRKRSDLWSWLHLFEHCKLHSNRNWLATERYLVPTMWLGRLSERADIML